jgi:hypothetical protein
MTAITPAAPIEKRIVILRGQRVMLDADLAEVYGVTTKRLNEQVKRNRKRFPEDFMFQLTEAEAHALRSQFATTRQHGGRRTLPYAFTEHGAVMLASVLSTPTAVKVSVLVVRAFIRLRELAGAHRDLAKHLDGLERKYDAKFRVVFDAIRALMEPPPKEPTKRRIGFLTPKKGE